MSSAASGNFPAQTEQSILAEVRDFMRDYEDLNRLISGEESSNHTLKWILASVLSRIADSPPRIGYFNPTEVPRHILRDGMVGETLLSAAIFYARNSLNYTDGQISVRETDKHREYVALAQYFLARFEDALTKWKMFLNISNAMSPGYGMHSDYYYLALGFYGDYPRQVKL